MIYCDGFIMGCGGSYADKKASWERAAKEKEAQSIAEMTIKLVEEKEKKAEEEAETEEIIDTIEAIAETVNDDYCDCM